VKAAVFSGGELRAAVVFALAVEVGIAALLIAAGGSRNIKTAEEPLAMAIPIAVRPVVDDLPLLKKGGTPVKTKLPDIWTKPKMVKRYKDVSAPSPAAPKTPEAIPSSSAAKADETPPPPEAEVAKEVDEQVPETEEKADQPNLPEEGAADGVKEGTEKDPLKARAVSLYRAKIISWFSVRFRVPVGQIDCATLQALSAGVSANIGSDRTVTGYSISRPSGNSIFDERVKAVMEATIGQELPPPPQNYPDILDSTVFPTFLGKGQECQGPANP
jgi:hypothetical protein